MTNINPSSNGNFSEKPEKTRVPLEGGKGVPLVLVDLLALELKPCFVRPDLDRPQSLLVVLGAEFLHLPGPQHRGIGRVDTEILMNLVGLRRFAIFLRKVFPP